MQIYSNNKFMIDSNNLKFKFKRHAKDCKILTDAVERIKQRMFPKIITGRESEDLESFGTPSITEISVSLMGSCKEGQYPALEDNEQYEIKVSTEDLPIGTTQILCGTVWGCLRGMNSMAQMVYINDNGKYQLNQTQIMDYPRFSHRGILLDSSRHFLTLKVIKDNLDLMEMNKFNVFHWHIVDLQSFPYVSKKFPAMSQKGAYDPKTHVYTQENVADIIEYARVRGIRVIPEFDTPGHTLSWEAGQPGLLTQCYTGDKPNGHYGPIDPSKNSTYEFIDAFFGEIASVFPDKYLHLGGDEVSFNCWKSNPHITAWMKTQNISSTDYAAVESYYVQKLVDFVGSKNKEYLVWNEVFNNGVKLSKNAVIHAWTGNTKKLLGDITKKGYRAILSEGWYLNYISYGSDWRRYYTHDPQDFPGTKAQKKLVVGGEACMWGEFVNSNNLVQRLWPRASAVAERLWSPANVTNIRDASIRIKDQECRMLLLGYQVEPIDGPGFCKYSLD